MRPPSLWSEPVQAAVAIHATASCPVVQAPVRILPVTPAEKNSGFSRAVATHATAAGAPNLHEAVAIHATALAAPTPSESDRRKGSQFMRLLLPLRSKVIFVATRCGD